MIKLEVLVNYCIVTEAASIGFSYLSRLLCFLSSDGLYSSLDMQKLSLSKYLQIIGIIIRLLHVSCVLS